MKRSVKSVPMSADVLFRHNARMMSLSDDRLSELGKAFAKEKSRRERHAWRVRKHLMRLGSAQTSPEDKVVASIAVQGESKYRPARVVWYDGRAKLLRCRPSTVIVERKRGKHATLFNIYVRQISRVEVSHA